MKFKIGFLLFITAVLLLPFQYALADIRALVSNIIDLYLWQIFAGIIIIMGIWAGILFFRGDPAKAKTAVSYTIIGAIVGLLGYFILSTIRNTLGF